MFSGPFKRAPKIIYTLLIVRPPPTTSTGPLRPLSSMNANLRNQARPPVPRPSPKKLRGRPKDSHDVQISKTLSYILRHGAKKEGIPMRPDGYVRVRDLLATPMLSSVDFLTIERLVQTDDKMRYHLKLEQDMAGESDGWWIRANQGHSLDEVDLELTPIESATDVPMAVHGTTRAAWRIIMNTGLSKMRRNHIHLAQGVAGSGVVSGMRSSSEILIYIDLARALADSIPFFLSANGVILSPGISPGTGTGTSSTSTSAGAIGFIPPRYFSKVTKANGALVNNWAPLEGESQRAVAREPVRAAQLPSMVASSSGLRRAGSRSQSPPEPVQERPRSPLQPLTVDDFPPLPGPGPKR